MGEQVQRQARRHLDDEQQGDIIIETDEQAAQASADAECCLADIDEALEAAACCLAEAEQVLKPKTWREMTDQEVIDAGDPMDGFRESPEYAALPPGTVAYSRAYMSARAEWLDHQERYDQAYQNITGLSNFRNCGCGRG